MPPRLEQAPKKRVRRKAAPKPRPIGQNAPPAPKVTRPTYEQQVHRGVVAGPARRQSKTIRAPRQYAAKAVQAAPKGVVYEQHIKAGKVAGPSITESRTVKVNPPKKKTGPGFLASYQGASFANRVAQDVLDHYHLVRMLPGGGKYIRNAAQDLIDTPANVIPGTYKVAKTAVTGHPKEAAKMLLEPYKQLVEHPGKTAFEHPLNTGLLLYGAKGGIGRALGRAGRLAPEGSTVGRAASMAREGRTLPTTTLREDRSYSPDVFSKSVQVARDKRRVRKVKRLQDQAVEARRAGDEDRAGDLETQARKAQPRVSDHEIRRRVDERVDANEIIRRQNRARVLKKVDEALPKKGKEAVPLVAQNITRADPKDLAAYRAEIESQKIKSPARKRQNKTLRRQIKQAEQAPDMKSVETAARSYRDVVKPLQDKLVESGLLGKEQADMAPLIPYATRHMDAKFVKEHYRSPGGVKLTNKEVRALRETHGDERVRQLATKVPGRLVDRHGNGLTAAAVRSHMQEHGFPEPAYVTQAPAQRGARNYFVSQHEAPSAHTRQRTGKATQQGTFDAHPDVLREGAARMQGLVDAHEGYSKFVGEFAHRRDDRQVRTYRSHGDATEHARDLAEETGVEWRPVKLKPFAGRREQLESLLDKTHPDNQLSMSEVTKALEDAVESTSGPGPWALIPKAAADQMSQHVRVMGAGGSGKAFQAVSGAFRKTVLATSLKWLFGNVAEATMRSGVARAGPRSYVTGKRIVSRLEKVDPEAAQELKARALGGGHFSMADRMPARRAEQFEGTRLEPIAKGLATFWRTPGPKQVAAVWKGWTDFVFHKVNSPLESRFQTAMLGSEVRRTLMDKHAVKMANGAIDDAVKGLRNTETQVRFARAVDDMYGRYSKFNPTERRVIALYTPFVAWSLNAVKFVTRVLPRDHPVLTALLVSSTQATEEWRKQHGLDKFMKGAVPGFLQGSIPVGEGKLRASRYTPFGFFGDPLASSADAVLPQFSGVLSAFKGEDWKGKELRGPDGEPLDDIGRAHEAAKAFAEATIPLAGQVGRVLGNEGGPLAGLRHEANPVEPIAPKKKTVRRKGGIQRGLGATGGYIVRGAKAPGGHIVRP